MSFNFKFCGYAFANPDRFYLLFLTHSLGSNGRDFVERGKRCQQKSAKTDVRALAKHSGNDITKWLDVSNG